MKKVVNQLRDYAEASFWGTYYIIKIMFTLAIMIAMGRFAYHLVITVLTEK